jgi:hemoglobin
MVLAFGAMAQPWSPVAAQTPAAAQGGSSLYHRLGGYDGLAAVTDDFIHRLATDPKLSKFFAGVSLEHQGRIRQLVLDQLCAATGGPCIYIGQDMKTVHKGLNISEDDWQAAVADFGGTMDKFHVGGQERGELVAILAKVKPDIVNSR